MSDPDSERERSSEEGGAAMIAIKVMPTMTTPSSVCNVERETTLKNNRHTHACKTANKAMTNSNDNKTQ